jgi:Fuc2NAc and GlcNAc transferase
VIAVGVFVALCFSIALSALARWYAVRAKVVDHPTERSSHVQPTPRGGGIGFVVTYLVALLALYLTGLLELELVVALVGAGSLVAAIGFADDHRHVPARYRFLVHVLAAAWVIYWLGMPSAATVFGSSSSWPIWLSTVLAILYVLWIINFYNFMDGIDGIASVEAVTVALGAALLAYLGNPEDGLSIAPLFLAAAVSGFLFFNLPPAASPPLPCTQSQRRRRCSGLGRSCSVCSSSTQQSRCCAVSRGGRGFTTRTVLMRTNTRRCASAIARSRSLLLW